MKLGTSAILATTGSSKDAHSPMHRTRTLLVGTLVHSLRLRLHNLPPILEIVSRLEAVLILCVFARHFILKNFTASGGK